MHDWFSGLSLGEPAVHEGLAVFPLLGADVQACDYLTLDEALASGHFRVTEVSAEGRVPELQAINSSDLPVLLLDGEELIGAKQNRILNLTVLVPPRAELTIPVSCVEAGRWRWSRRDCASSGSAAFAELRAVKAMRVTEALAAHRERHSNQSEVWNMVEGKMSALGTRSATQSMHDLYRAYRGDTEAFCKAIAPLPQQRGALFAIEGRIAGMDLFDCSATFAKYLPKLLHGYALDALTGRAAASSKEEAGTFLNQVLNAAATVDGYPAIGLGRDLRFSGREVHGAALDLDGRIVHLCAFRNGAQSQI